MLNLLSKKFKPVVLIVLLFLLGSAMASYAIQERTYLTYADASKPAAGRINFTAFYKGSDNLIQTEDSYNNTNDAGWYDAIGYARVESDQFTGLSGSDAYDIWLAATDKNEAGRASGTVGLTSPNYTTPGTSTNKLVLASTNFLAIPTGTGAIPGDTRALLVWSQVSGATGYAIYKTPVAGNANKVYQKVADITSGSTTSYMATGLTNGTAVYFIMVAKTATTRSGHTDEFTVTSAAGAPVISSVSPSSGQTGIDVTIAGTGFGASAGKVRFNSNVLTTSDIVSWSDTSIKIKVPNYPNGVYNVTVATAGDKAISNNDKTFTIGTVNPVISISPQTPAFTANTGSNPAPNTQVITLSNTGTAALTTWTAGAVTYTGGQTNWVTLSKSTGGPINAGASDSFTITIGDVTTFTAGTYTATIPLTFSQGLAAQNVVVTLTIGGVQPPTSVVIDDMEGTLVNPNTGYYNITPQALPNQNAPHTRTQTAGELHEGTYGMRTTLAVPAASPNDWRGWGGILAKPNLDLSSYNTISFWVKGDGSTHNKVKIQFKDANNSNVSLPNGAEIPLSGTAWQQISISKSTFSNYIAGANFDWSKVIEYQFIFSGQDASNGIFIDYVNAYNSQQTTDPVISSISPAKAVSGDTVTITGTNLSTAGKIEFAGVGLKSYIESAAVNSAISTWSATSIIFKVPSTLSGKLDVSVIRSSDAKQSNAVSFEVTSQSTGTSYNYPNPFNPNGGETTKIVFTPGSAASATVYIFDSTAQVVGKLPWTSGSTAEVTWNGKSPFGGNLGDALGDGVYLYRVADGSKLLGRGKILIINR